jgi:Cu2+-exporting ATPase
MDFADSSLGTLLRQVAPRDGVGPTLHFWDRLARRWVLAVLTIAATGSAAWLWRAGAGRALDVAVSLLVVTCPCAIGIALPLGYELVQARLRRAGFFARSTDLLDRLERVRCVVFDKTGTLTSGCLELAEPAVIAALEPEARDAAYNLACRSGHPVAMALARALGTAGARYDQSARTAEVMGRGVEGRFADGARWRLGRWDWAFASAGAASPPAPEQRATVLAREGRLVARFETREALRPDARAQVQALTAAGYEAWIVSGDVPSRVAALGAVLGLPSHHVLGGCSPEGKAAALDAIGAADAVYVGDGVNDALAFDHALAAGTVAIERPVLPGRSDFFLVGDSLAPLGQALAAARRLRVVVRRVLRISIAYNAFAVTSCLLGLMTPVRAAIFMPASSIGLLLFTAASLAGSSIPQLGPRAVAPSALPAPARGAA